MKTRVFLLLAFTMLTLAFTGCEDDAPPANNVGSITFIITEENTPETLSGVTIELYSNSDPSVTQTDRTDNSGRCIFSNIPVGTYQVNIRKSGYESKSNLTLRINGGNNPYKEISLKRATNVLTVAPDVLDFGENTSVVQKAFSLVNPNYQDLTWAVLDTDVPWIVSVCDKDGKKNGTIKYNQEVAMSVTIDRSKLDKGNNESTIVILSDYGRAELVVKAVGVDILINMNEVVNVDQNTVEFKGEVVKDKSLTYSERGFVYSTCSIESFDDKKNIVVAAQVNSKDSYSVTVTNLTPNTEYYVRAYVKTSSRISLSNERKFGVSTQLTAVSTLDIETMYVENGRVYLQGIIESKGSPVYTERGFCYNMEGEPDINDTKLVVSGSMNTFYYWLSPIENDSYYYVKAYAIQNGQTIYGGVKVLSTHPREVQVVTKGFTDFTDYGTITLNGMIVDAGFPNYYEKGFCYATHKNPTINDTKESIVLDNTHDVGDFSLQTWIDATQKYYYRAYAIQDGKVYYGDVVPITKENRPAQVVTDHDKRYLAMDSSAVLYGKVTSTGFPHISERGIEYGTTQSYSTSWTQKRDEWGDIYSTDGEYCVELLLSGATVYYYRAYVIQAGEKIYGNTHSFMTHQSPLIYTEIYPHISSYKQDGLTCYKVELSALELRGAYPECTGYGFICSTSPNVDLSSIGSIVIPATDISYEDGFKVITATMDNLYIGDTYYYRAYAIADDLYYYGDIESFSVY